MEVEFETEVSNQDRMTWWLGLERLAKSQEVRIGMRQTDDGFAIAFEHKSDAIRLTEQYERQCQEFAEAYRQRGLERVHRMRRDYPERFGNVKLPDDPAPSDL